MDYTVQKISNTRMAFANAANLVSIANMVAPYILFDLQRKYFSNGASENKDLHFVSSCTIYCMERTISTTGLMLTMGCGTNLASLTLRFSLSHIPIYIISLRAFPSTRLTQCINVGPGLHSTVRRKTNFQQCFHPSSLQWQFQLD